MSLRKKDGKVYGVFPMEITRAQLGTGVVYDRDTRGKSWFILEVVGQPGKFIPRGSDGLSTSDGTMFLVGRRYT